MPPPRVLCLTSITTVTTPITIPNHGRAMQHYLLLGLELQLYATAEIDQVLWYLDCLLTVR